MFNEFFSEENLGRKYKIPKKSPSNESNNNTKTEPPFLHKHSANLADAYYSFPYDPRAASAYQNFPHFPGNVPGPGSHQKNNLGFKTPPPPPPPIDGVEPIKQNIYKTLKDIRERPKKYDRNIFQQTVPDLLDQSLPKELKLLFQPLFCKLCSAQLSSNQTAKLHYKSKNHEKKIRKWLVEWSEKTGEPVPKRALVTNTKKEEDPEKNPTWYHCDICDLELTGKLHAESHYMGRNHQKASLGHKTPAGHGYFKDGKWVRVKGQKSKLYDFEKGEDNFGMDFKNIQEQTGPCDADSDEPPIKKKKEALPSSQFHCDVCNINTTCQEQLDNHFRGQKHAKKLKQFGLDDTEHGKSAEPPAAVSTPTPNATDNSFDPDMNLSVYRTPSGDYYCPICNITTNSEPQFLQHMRSKGHAKKASQKKAKSNN